MTADLFLKNFGYLADAPNGIAKLRELILQLAVQGKLVPQDNNDEPVRMLIQKINNITFIYGRWFFVANLFSCC